MALVYQQNINEVTKLGVWKIYEEESFFLNRGLSKPAIQHSGKRLQTLAGRNLLTELYPDFPLHEVRIAPTRKPFLPNAPFHFSISHCGSYAAAIVSRKWQVGVDVEIPALKIIGIKNKFTTLAEQEILAATGMDEVAALTAAWSIKEAVFKWYGAGGVDFKEHLKIEHFHFHHNAYEAAIRFLKSADILLPVNGLFLHGTCLSWVLSKPY